MDSPFYQQNGGLPATSNNLVLRFSPGNINYAERPFSGGHCRRYTHCQEDGGMPAQESSSVVQIGEWAVHPARDTISRGNETQKLEPRAMRLLLCLANSPGDVVSIDRLLSEVWTGVVVGSASVYEAVSHLRKILGDVDAKPTYIATIPRKGYRLIAPVQRVTVGAEKPAARALQKRMVAQRRVWVVGAIIVLALTAAYFSTDKEWLSTHTMFGGSSVVVSDKSIAVLPFADMSEKKDQEYFSDGLAEELIEQLGNTPGLKVIARTSSFSFKGKSDDIPTIASKLNVANVLEGSVRRSGSHLRISTQLIRADSGQSLWSETFDREFRDVFAIQDEIAVAVVSALKLKLAGGQTATGAHGTTNPEAYNAYLLGRNLYIRSAYIQSTETGYRQAIEAYQKAIDLDPRYADAYAELAMAQYYLGDYTGDLALETSAEQAAQQAIEIDQHRASGYAVRGYLRFNMRYDWVGAEADFKQALVLDPTDSRVFRRYASVLNQVGRTEEAAALLQKGIEQDPLDASTWTGLVDALVASRNYPAAYDAVRRALAIRPTDNSSNFQLACLQLFDGKARDALATFQSNSFAIFRDTGVAMAEHTLGDAKSSQQALDRVIATAAGDAAYQIAEIYAWRGEKDKAFEWLERAYRQQDGGLTGIKIDLVLASLRSDPRYVAMLRKLNLPP
jgi:TolB-like protein/DNA-binding winged helix-turn-helix (wHTH) protein/Tfp pilus assembly protein PilF